MGTLIGVLPGIGPVAGVAMLIPLTFHMTPTGAIKSFSHRRVHTSHRFP